MEEGEEVSEGVKRSLCGDEVVENGEKKIKIAEDLSDENNETELSKKPRALLDLNDDCFYSIFSYLKTYDLTNVANTCVRFRNCATYVFQHYHKGSICFDYPCGGGFDNVVRCAVRIFGPHSKKLSLNMKIFNKLFSSDSPLRMVAHYCNRLDTITLNELQFMKWFPAKYIDYMKLADPDSDDSDDNYDPDDDREWMVGDVAPRFLTNLPQVKNVIVNKGMLFCGGRLFDDWKHQVETITMRDVLVGDGFLKALRDSYDEVKMIIRNETRRGRGDVTHNNFRIVEAIFTPKWKGKGSVKT